MGKIIPYLVLLSGLLLLGEPIGAQNPENATRDLTELLMDFHSSAIDATELEQMVADWTTNKPSLNKMEREDFKKFFFLAPNHIDSILAHRKRYGNFLSRYELMAVDGLPIRLAELLGNFTITEERTQMEQLGILPLIREARHELILQEGRDVERSKGYTATDGFMGSPDHISVRYRLQAGKRLQLGFSLEKDAGENWGKAGDFQSVHFFYRGKGLLNQLALGDFQSNFGKGLVMGNSLFAGKSPMVMQTRYLAEGFKPYRSLNESGFLRGMALNLVSGHWQISPWISLTPATALLRYDSLQNEDGFQSINKTGLHRTNREISFRNSIYKGSEGVHLKYANGKYVLGSVINHQYFFIPTNTSGLWKAFQNGTLTGSVFTEIQLRQFQVGAEIASQTRSRAMVVHSLIPLHAKVDLLILYRNYGTGFLNPNGNGWSSSGRNNNEKGIYFALSYRPSRSATLNAFTDHFQNPSPTYLQSFPGFGSDQFIELNKQFSKTYSLILRYRIQHYTKDANLETKTQALGSETRQNLRLELKLDGPDISYKFRTEVTSGSKTDHTNVGGILCFYQVKYHPKGSRYRADFFVCRYFINDYLARIFVHEPDLPFNYSQSQFNGNGIKIILQGGYKINRHSEIFLRYDYRREPGKETMGTAMDVTQGDHQSGWKVLLKMNL